MPNALILASTASPVQFQQAMERMRVSLHDVIADAIQPALMAGVMVLGDELLKRMPRGPRGDTHNLEFAPLETSMVTDILVDRKALKGSSSTGFGKSGPVALWVEYGHQQVARSSTGARYRSPFSGRERKGELIGSVPEHPFMRPSVDAAYPAIVDAVTDSIADSLARAFGGTR